MIQNIKYWLLLVLIARSTLSFSVNLHEGFIENKGQLNESVLFEKSLPNGSLFIENGLLKYIFYDDKEWRNLNSHPHLKKESHKNKTLHFHTIIIKMTGGKFDHIDKRSPAAGYLNYFIGDNQKKWASNVQSFENLYISDVWPNIDLELLAQGSSIKYNFILHPGADIELIQLLYEGAEQIRLENKRNLLIKTSVNEYTESLPLAYTLNNNSSSEVACEYLLDKQVVRFKLSNQYKNQTLILDPILVFSTYSGSSVDNFGFTATYDSRGCLYAGGIASKPTTFPNGRYPTSGGAFQYNYGGGDAGGWEGFPCDISITKYTPDGDSIVWATYLGGSKNEYPHSIVVDQNDQLIVFGTTTSANFPKTLLAFDTSYNGAFDMILSKLSYDGGKLTGSTYIGGSGDDGFNVDGPLKYNYADEFRGEVDIDNTGNIYIASSTRSKNFPVTAGAPQDTASDSLEAVMIKFDSLLTKPFWCSYWGKKGHDAFYSVEVVGDTLVYFGGSTNSKDLLTDSLAINTAYIGGRADGYIACFTNDSLHYLRGTYIGTSAYNQLYFIEQDIKGKIYATGQTDGSFPIVGSVYSQPNSGQFIIKISPDLRQTILSTTFGNGSSTADLNPSAFMVDYCENIYFSGWGSDVANPEDHVGTTSGLYVSNNAVQKTTDGNDFYLIVFSKNLQSIAYATYFGSPGQAGEFNDHVDGGTSRFDPRGVVYQSVCSSCPAGGLNSISNFPTSSNAYSKNNPSPRCSNASFKIDFQITNAVIADFTAKPNIQCFPGNIQISNKSTGGKFFFWDFGDGTNDTAKNPTHNYQTAGQYKIMLVVNDSNSCNINDTAYRTVELLQGASADFTIIQDSCSFLVKAINQSNYIATSLWYWGDGSSDTTKNAQHIYKSKGTYTIKLLINGGLPCSDSLEKIITVEVDSSIKAGFTLSPRVGCSPLQVAFNNTSSKAGYYFWDFGDGTQDTVENPIHIYKNSGKYTVKLLLHDKRGCLLKDSVTDSVTVLPHTIPAFEAVNMLCSLAVDFVNLSKDGDPYMWDFGNGDTSSEKSPSYTYKKAGKYDVKFISGKGGPCADSITKSIEVKQDSSGALLIPNVFTPDDDGINDCYKPGGVQSGCDEFKMYIYNMWGELLFETNDIEKCWTGKKSNGDLHPTGTYYWLMEISKGKTTTTKHKGHVLLLRKE